MMLVEVNTGGNSNNMLVGTKGNSLIGGVPQTGP